METTCVFTYRAENITTCLPSCVKPDAFPSLEALRQLGPAILLRALPLHFPKLLLRNPASSDHAGGCILIPTARPVQSSTLGSGLRVSCGRALLPSSFSKRALLTQKRTRQGSLSLQGPSSLGFLFPLSYADRVRGPLSSGEVLDPQNTEF